FCSQAEAGIRDCHGTGAQTCALPILSLGAINGEPAHFSTVKVVSRVNKSSPARPKLGGVYGGGMWQIKLPHRNNKMSRISSSVATPEPPLESSPVEVGSFEEVGGVVTGGGTEIEPGLLGAGVVGAGVLVPGGVSPGVVDVGAMV